MHSGINCAPSPCRSRLPEGAAGEGQDEGRFCRYYTLTPALSVRVLPPRRGQREREKSSVHHLAVRSVMWKS